MISRPSPKHESCKGCDGAAARKSTMNFHAPFEVHSFDAYHAVLPKNGSLQARHRGLIVASHCKNVESKLSSYMRCLPCWCPNGRHPVAFFGTLCQDAKAYALPQSCSSGHMPEEVRGQNHRANFSTPLAPCLRGDLMTRMVIELMNTSPHASPRDIYGPLHRKLWAARRMEASS